METMKARIDVKDDMLHIILTEVNKADRGRVCRIELKLLRAYQHHKADPWVWTGPYGYTVRWSRKNTQEAYKKASDILRGFGL